MANGFQIDVPGGGWSAANQGLSDIGSGIGQWARQQQALQMMERQRQNELQDAIMLYKMKAQFESQNKSPLESLIERSNAAKAAEILGDEGLYNQIRGNQFGQPANFGSIPSFDVPQQAHAGNRVERLLNAGLPSRLSLTPRGSFNDIRPFNPMQDYQMVPAGELNAFGKPKMKFDLKPEAALKRKVEETKAIESAKPYTADEIKVVSGLSLIPQIDKLIKLVEDENVYGEGKFGGNLVPFGASRIAAFGEQGPWQSFKRGLTAGAGRKAGLILQDIKQIMFATGGQALTDPEILKLGPKMEPSYKTEKQWIEDLKDVKQRIIEKARLMRPNPNELYQNNSFSQQQQQNISPEAARQELIRRGLIE